MTDNKFNTKEFIEKNNWHFAKTMPQNPHEYCLRRETDETEFEEFVKLIRREGYQELYWGKMYICYNVGQYKYWTMGEPLEKTILINRAKLPENKD